MRGVVLLAVLVLAACQPSTQYPQETQDNFTNSCRLSGASEAHCGCVWARIEAEVPLEEFRAADETLRAGGQHPLSQRILAFNEACQATP
jgi:hypothetical protein